MNSFKFTFKPVEDEGRYSKTFPTPNLANVITNDSKTRLEISDEIIKWMFKLNETKDTMTKRYIDIMLEIYRNIFHEYVRVLAPTSWVFDTDNYKTNQLELNHFVVFLQTFFPDMNPFKMSFYGHCGYVELGKWVLSVEKVA